MAAASRYSSVVELGSALAAIYGWPPREKRPRPLKGSIGIPLFIIVCVVGIWWAASFLVPFVLRQLGPLH